MHKSKFKAIQLYMENTFFSVQHAKSYFNNKPRMLDVDPIYRGITRQTIQHRTETNPLSVLCQAIHGVTPDIISLVILFCMIQ